MSDYRILVEHLPSGRKYVGNWQHHWEGTIDFIEKKMSEGHLAFNCGETRVFLGKEILNQSVITMEFRKDV